MPAKRYRVIQDNEVFKPLQSKATNIKSHAILPTCKPTSNEMRRNNKSPKRKRRKQTRSKGSRKEQKQSGTVFHSNDVELKVASQHPFADLNKTTDIIEQQPRHGRLTRIDEEEESLKLEDFEQPPQSTSTPILGNSIPNSAGEAISPTPRVDLPCQVSPVLYAYNPMVYQYPHAYPYPYPYGYSISNGDSPLQSKVNQERPIDFCYNGVLERTRLLESKLPLRGGLKNDLQFRYQLYNESDEKKIPFGMTESIFAPASHSMFQSNASPLCKEGQLTQCFPLFNNCYVKDEASSESSSYKSSGGDATYQGSAKS